MARGMQERKKRPTQVIPRSQETSPTDTDMELVKVTFSVQRQHVEMLEDFIYHARKQGLRTNKSEVIRSLIEVLQSVDMDSSSYVSMEGVKQALMQRGGQG